MCIPHREFPNHLKCEEGLIPSAQIIVKLVPFSHPFSRILKERVILCQSNLDNDFLLRFHIQLKSKK